MKWGIQPKFGIPEFIGGRFVLLLAKPSIPCYTKKQIVKSCSQSLLVLPSKVFLLLGICSSVTLWNSRLSRCAAMPSYQLMRFFASALPEHIMVSMPALSPVVDHFVIIICRLWLKEVFLLGVWRKVMLFNLVTFLLKFAYLFIPYM